MGHYKVLTGEFADLMLGYYGKTIGSRNPEVIELAAKQTGKKPITCRPGDLLKPEWQDLRTAALELEAAMDPMKMCSRLRCFRRLRPNSSLHALRARKTSAKILMHSPPQDWQQMRRPRRRKTAKVRCARRSCMK